jgi:ribosome biogenesis GTPase A
MARGERKLAELAEKLDLIIEVRDARAPFSTSSPFAAELSRLRPVLIVLSKKDLADPDRTRVWLEELSRPERGVWAFDLRRGVEPLRRGLARFRPPHRELRLAVAGIPNVGKSMLLNALVGKSAARVGGIPGVTREVSWYKGSGFLVVDSPGILDPHAEPGAHRVLSWLGCAKAEVLGGYEAAALELIAFLRARGLWETVAAPWGLGETGPSEHSEETLSRVGRRLGCLVAGGAVNLELTGRKLMDSFAGGKLPPVTLELPGEPLCPRAGADAGRKGPAPAPGLP